MGRYSFTNGYDGDGSLEKITAMVQEIKASPKSGHKRLVVREKGKTMSHAVIDIKMKDAKDVEEKKSYMFDVREKDYSRNPGQQRRKAADFKGYDCEGMPEDYTPAAETQARFNRFGGGAGGKKVGRTKF